ncbi:MAG: T9SS type A sorting domain-containing protein [Bacteroidia bacterium]|nr:T9SS type A sorting domain-containing protein [Bacteroidia bacterium]
MKVIIFAFALVLYSTLVTAQSGWRYIGPEEHSVTHMSILGDLIFTSVSIPRPEGGYNARRIYRSTDAGDSWSLLDTNLIHPSTVVTILEGEPTRLWGATASKIYFSNDLGVSWDSTDQQDPSIGGLIQKKNVPGLVFGFRSINHRFERLYRSTDFGRTWQWPYPFPYSSDGSIIALAVSETSRDVYVNVDTDIGGAYFFHSADDGETWQFVAESPLNIGSLSVDPDLTNQILATQGNQLLLSEDRGSSWTIIYTDNDNRGFRSLTRNLKNANELFRFNSNTGAISHSQSRGFTWTVDSSSLDLPYKSYWNSRDANRWLQHDASRNRLYFETRKGIYIRDNLSTNLTATEIPPAPLIQVYPQPARESMTVNIEMPAASSTTLRLYNTLGTMVREQRVSAPGSFQWDLRDSNNRELPSGIYLLTMFAGQERLTRLILIQR